MSQMFNEDDDLYGEDDNTGESQDRNPLRQQISRLERQLKEARKQAEAGTKASRMLEFAKAGVPLDDPRTKYFIAGYEGDLSPEAIKTEAETFGLVKPAAENSTVPTEDQKAMQRISQATTADTIPGERDFDAEMFAATSAEQVDKLAAEKARASGQTQPGVVYD